MAHRIGRMPLAPEVYVLQAEVGGDQRFVAPGKRQHGAVVADAVAGALSAPSLPRDESVRSATFRSAARLSFVRQPAQYTRGHVMAAIWHLLL